MKKSALLLLLFIISKDLLFAQRRQQEEFHVNLFTENVFHITEVLFHDVVNPPAAARFYAYAALAAQHVTAAHQNGVDLSATVRVYPNIPPENNGSAIEPQFAATYAMLETAKNIIPSGYSLEDKQLLLYNEYRQRGSNRVVLDSSVAYAIRVARAFTAWSKTDGYLTLSVRSKYDPIDADSTWFPTPPEYMSAVEPHWSTVRTFFLDSCSQFKPAPPTCFDSREGSPFYRQMYDVYEVSKHLNEETKLIAAYWDCNPFANFYSGHLNVAIKKISPGGHWMSITSIACKEAKAPFVKTVFAHALVALGLHDGFVSCWDEKYRSHRIRPKTAINKFIDERWNPLLETPPFPEYTSGHSVISTVSAVILTMLFGDNFGFTDTTEAMFGLPSRKFRSFNEAAAEAAISRFYGGIHYKDAIEKGQEQGESIGKFIVTRLHADHAGSD